jgi:lipid II:glycine glycyltransferase (peptidoglycan interpeptide bridge formation enzyme)
MEGETYLKKLVDYLKKNLKKGYTLESLKWGLIGQGYSRTAVERAIDELNKELAKKAPVLKEKPTIKYEIIDENDKPVTIKKSFWKRIFGL